ncbi:DUF397 domain-containing protein [Streptomyces sp. DSM 41982]|uniref:DUF397 domain-containing protein n=1 Tax=Streptomyces evansiae TaxID=3075535 RepID=A0ABD5DZF8_9ACTN|nr:MULTISPECIES: DUF397 domain-containing protein [unclassified Streptomyces]MDT0414604.1 DUF397 domain-containing protein [Streptomyces sp. DSM 41982]SCD32976.1 protein of unknown function [Streptomyces sp. SolWspMP-sol7th]
MTVELSWFKSSYSGSGGSDCVEVALTPLAVHVRDSKDTTRPGFTAAPTAWADFLLEAVRARCR